VRRHVIPGARLRKIDFADSEYEPGRRSGQAAILKGAVAAISSLMAGSGLDWQKRPGFVRTCVAQRPCGSPARTARDEQGSRGTVKQRLASDATASWATAT
jgi:hypothetical protein